MVHLLDPVKDLFGSLSSLALVGALFKPVPPLIGAVQDAVNGLGLLPAGLQLNALPGSVDASLCAVNYTAPAPSNITFQNFNHSQASVYRYRQQYAVNMGGWFVHEQWMTPTLFTCAAANKSSEIDLAAGFGSVDNARQALEQHWDTFIDLDNDLAYLAGMGINTLRLPIGYWSLGPDFVNGTAFEAYGQAYNGSWPRIMNVISHAEKHNLGVIVDLHGAPGSQNGLPHSGVSDGVQGLFGNASNIAATQRALTFMAQQLAVLNNVVGIELLNEPASVPQLESFYEETISMMRNATAEAASLPLYIHDAYDLPRFSAFVANRSDMVVLDHHAYYVFGAGDVAAHSAPKQAAPVLGRRQLPASATAATPSTPSAPNAPSASPSAPAPVGDGQQSLNATSDDLLQASNATHRNLIIGEWSCALSNSSLTGKSDPLGARRDFCTAQQNMYANVTSGWAFWNYQMEDCNAAWCFRSAVGSALPSKFSAWTSLANSSRAFDDLVLQQQIAALAQKPADEILDHDLTENKLVSAGMSAFPSSASGSSAPASASFASASVSSMSAEASASASMSGVIKLASDMAASTIYPSDSAYASMASPSASASASDSLDASPSATDSSTSMSIETASGFAEWYASYRQTATMYQPPSATVTPASAYDSSVPTESAFVEASMSSTENAMPTPAPGDAMFARRPESAHFPQRRWGHARLHAGRYRPRIHPRDFVVRRTTYTPQEQAIVKAYSDGFTTAKAFAQLGGSRLGFAAQMIQENIAVLVGTPDLSDGMQEVYADWFRAGLADAEEEVRKLLSRAPAKRRFARAQ